MMAPTHIMGGITCGAAAVYLSNGAVTPLIIPISAAAALIPDIDHKNSKISHKLPILSFLVRLFSGHRGLFHTMVPYLLLAGIGYPWYSQSRWIMLLVFGSLLGVFSHLILDAFTKQGVPLLFPITRKDISFLRVKTNSWAESTVFVLLLGTTCLLSWRIMGSFL